MSKFVGNSGLENALWSEIEMKSCFLILGERKKNCGKDLKPML